MTASPDSDRQQEGRIAELRERISANDRAILEAVNRRLELVAEMKAYKASRGIPFLDLSREEQMLRELVGENQGPLSEDGLRRLFAEILDLSKREVARTEATSERP
jgi:chorismate mutase